MTVRIPISADAGNVVAQIDRIREALRRAGQETRELAKIDLSHPELRGVADDLRKINEQVERLNKEARGPTAATFRTLTSGGRYDGSGAGLFGPGGILADPSRWNQVRPNDGTRHYVNAARYILQGTQFAPPSPPAAGAGIPIGTPPASSGGVLSGAAGSAMSGAAGLMRGFIPAMLAMAGLQRVGAMAGEAVQQARDEAMATDRLIRSLRDLDTGFAGLRDKVAATTRGLGMTYQEAQQVAATWTAMTNEQSADGVASNVRFAAGFARGYGIDPNTVASGFGRATFMGDNPRRFAGILAEAIQQSGMTGRPTEVMETLLRFQEQSARRIGPAGAMEHFAGAYALMSSQGGAYSGLRGAGAEALLGQMNQAIMAGGAGGEASQYLTFRAFSRYGVNDVFQQQYAREGGMFAGVDGGAARAGTPTIFQAVMEELNRQYPGTSGQDRYRRFHALGRHFGITARQAEAISDIMGSGQPGRLGSLNAALADANVSITDMNETGIRDAAEIAAPGADLNRWRNNVTGRLGANDPRRARLAGLEGDDLRRELLRVVAELGRQQNQGSEAQQAMANFSNALTTTGRGMLPVLTDMRSILADFVGVVGSLSETIGDGYLALTGDADARARLTERMRPGLTPQGGTAPGANGLPGSVSDPQRAARAQQAYDHYRSQGISHEMAVGMLANIEAESGFNPNSTHERDGRGFGILGWNNDGERAGRPGRITNMGFFVAQRRGLPTPTSYAEATALGRTATYEEQVAFSSHEGLSGDERDNWRRAQSQSPGQAGSAISRFVIRPGDMAGQAAGRAAGAVRWDRFIQNRGADLGMGQFGPAAPSMNDSEAAAAALGVRIPGADGAPPPAAAPAPGDRQSFRFDPLRVVVENGRGDTLTEQFLRLNPSTGLGAPMPWGIG